MKSATITSILFSLLVFSGTLSAQVEFIEVASLEEMVAARQKASEQKLPLFVDVYATWCGPCKMMDREVYPDPAVSEYMNSSFINVKMDGESEYGSQFAAEHGLQGYPSVFLFDAEGSHMSTLVGFMDAPELLDKLKSSVGNYKVTRQMKQSYESGSLDKSDYALYLSSLRAMGEEEAAEKVALTYLVQMDEEADLTDDDIRVVSYYMTMDHALWPELSGDIDRMKTVLGEDYMLVIESVFNRTLMKGIEEENVAIIKVLSDNIGSFLEGQDVDAESLVDLPYLQYYYYSNKFDELFSYVDDIFAESRAGDHQWLFSAASRVIDMDQQYLTPEIQEKGVEWFQACIELDEQYDYFFYKGMCLFFTDQRQEAKGAFTKAAGLTEDPEETQMIRQVMDFIESQE